MVLVEAARRLIVDKQIELTRYEHVQEETPLAGDLDIEIIGQRRHPDMRALGVIDIADTPLQVAGALLAEWQQTVWISAAVALALFAAMIGGTLVFVRRRAD